VTAVHELLASSADAHDFTDAPCIGRWRWFDPPGEQEAAASVQGRQEAAVRVCGTCPIPVFARCAALARTLPKTGRHGVWAGTSYDATTHHRAPRTACAAPGCPFLTREEYCPAHRHADPSAPQTTRTDAGSTTHQHTHEGASPC